MPRQWRATARVPGSWCAPDGPVQVRPISGSPDRREGSDGPVRRLGGRPAHPQPIEAWRSRRYPPSPHGICCSQRSLSWRAVDPQASPARGGCRFRIIADDHMAERPAANGRAGLGAPEQSSRHASRARPPAPSSGRPWQPELLGLRRCLRPRACNLHRPRCLQPQSGSDGRQGHEFRGIITGAVGRRRTRASSCPILKTSSSPSGGSGGSMTGWRGVQSCRMPLAARERNGRSRRSMPKGPVPRRGVTNVRRKTQEPFGRHGVLFAGTHRGAKHSGYARNI